MREKLEYFIVKLFIWLVGLLPNSALYKTMKFIAKLFFKYEKRRSVLTFKNLKAAFPDKNEEEIYRLAIGAYDNIAITMAEIILMLNDKLDFDAMINGKEEFLEKLKEYTKDAKNGVIIITAHFSNWELAAQFLPRNGYPMVAVGRKGNNKLIEKQLTTPFRERYGNKNVYKEQAILNIIKALKESKNVGLLIDQKAGGKSSIKVKFFGLDADTTNSIAVLKLKYNPLIIPIFAPRDKDGKYTPLIIEPIEYIAEEESDKNKKIEKMTQRYNDIFEEVIRTYPEQWFWMHNRWRLS
ncbi:lysophospholipid acyltransferase family protein [Sulfurospirillum arcachonense]|uniref:lysophospholipid acyltransferase family protein n=1 Tax=Sulfurospirillum arcachonense TaxID=57666 RepID=UPI000468791C|nr:lysophospholipid acyltransferase family protein [Sulfurospirillum arcachonense]